MQDAGMQTGISLRGEEDEEGAAAAAGADGSPAAGAAGGDMYDDGGYDDAGVPAPQPAAPTCSLPAVCRLMGPACRPALCLVC